MKRFLYRKMLAEAKRDGEGNGYLVEVVAEYADSWCNEFEEKHDVALTDKERSEAIDAFTWAFYCPEGTDKSKPATPYDYVKDRLSRCDVPQD